MFISQGKYRGEKSCVKLYSPAIYRLSVPRIIGLQWQNFPTPRLLALTPLGTKLSTPMEMSLTATGGRLLLRLWEDFHSTRTAVVQAV